MANHGPAYGLAADEKAKMESKYDTALESELRQWIEQKTGEKIGDDFFGGLKDGVILCNLANKLKPGAVGSINKSKMAFKQMENISAFLKAVELLGVPKESSFMTVDLYEAKNPPLVLDTLNALRRLWH
eukprot:TRINITY_DN5968_c1_g1_i1.p1 TRINITY_DN5968_c1_g1~~TRINITY_DN5968_c1_g1_i1.p1  ORF type:complete len:129 (-),score=38.41 TRINITY_DN5968_c1_g1_i1:108-494(-)